MRMVNTRLKTLFLVKQNLGHASDSTRIIYTHYFERTFVSGEFTVL